MYTVVNESPTFYIYVKAFLTRFYRVLATVRALGHYYHTPLLQWFRIISCTETTEKGQRHVYRESFRQLCAELVSYEVTAVELSSFPGLPPSQLAFRLHKKYVNEPFVATII